MGRRNDEPVPQPGEPERPLRGPEWAHSQRLDDKTDEEISDDAATIRIADDT